MTPSRSQWYSDVQRMVGLIIYLFSVIILQSPIYLFLFLCLYLLLSTTKYELIGQRSKSLVCFSLFLFCIGRLRDMSIGVDYANSSYLCSFIALILLSFAYGKTILRWDWDFIMITHLQRWLGFLILITIPPISPPSIESFELIIKVYCFLSAFKYLYWRKYANTFIRLGVLMLPIFNNYSLGWSNHHPNWIGIGLGLLCFAVAYGIKHFEKNH